MPQPEFETRLVRDADDLRAAQALRYDVFVREMGGDGPMVDHAAGLERDKFDPDFDHLLLLDHNRADQPVVGVYRLLPSDKMPAIGQFYSEDEFDISALKASGRKLLELGRACVHPDYRGGTAMYHLWNGLTSYILEREIEVLFGAAIFPGTDVQALAQPLSHLYHNHLAPDALRVRSLAKHYQPMDLLPRDQIDRVAAAKQIPALIKAYLRLGGFVGDGAYVDHAFNSTDVCLIIDTTKMSQRHRAFYEKRDRA